MPKTYNCSIWWIKRDFRLEDNEPLVEAALNSRQVLPLYIHEPSITSAPDFSDFHSHACFSALSELKKNLDGKLWFDVCEFEEAIQGIEEYTKINAVFSYEETGTSFTFNRDKRVALWLKNRSIPWIEIPRNGVVRRLKSRSVRSSIWETRIEQEVLSPPDKITTPSELNTIFAKQVIPPTKSSKLENITESTAKQRLHSFLEHRGIRYSGSISSPNTAFQYGSRLSAQLAWGTISLRQVFSALSLKRQELQSSNSPEAKKWSRSLSAFASRLHWHDHFIQRLESEPEMEFEPLNKVFRELPYVESPERLDAWLTGQTGEPLVDACMRCLGTTGFLNFRMRAMVVSYACHVLHLSWRDIMYPLGRLFLDYEPGIHISQIQMQAGVVGINTLRVYSPEKQMAEQDPKLNFVRKWVPELREIPAHTIINYRKNDVSCYPSPIVDYKENSKLMKDAFYALKKSPAGREASKVVLEKHGSKRPARHKKTQKKDKENNKQLSLF